MKGFTYEIIEHIAKINESSDGRFTLELNRISYNGSLAKLDLRRWNREQNTMMKGLTLTEAEAKEIMFALERIFR